MAHISQVLLYGLNVLRANFQKYFPSRRCVAALRGLIGAHRQNAQLHAADASTPYYSPPTPQILLLSIGAGYV
jgi:hypothetical protein